MTSVALVRFPFCLGKLAVSSARLLRTDSFVVGALSSLAVSPCPARFRTDEPERRVPSAVVEEVLGHVVKLRWAHRHRALRLNHAGCGCLINIGPLGTKEFPYGFFFPKGVKVPT
jgi:hypothetical protein